jgi:hypothetical protein
MTRTSCGTPKSARVLIAGSITGRSLSLPMTIITFFICSAPHKKNQKAPVRGCLHFFQACGRFPRARSMSDILFLKQIPMRIGQRLHALKLLYYFITSAPFVSISIAIFDILHKKPLQCSPRMCYSNDEMNIILFAYNA